MSHIIKILIMNIMKIKILYNTYIECDVLLLTIRDIDIDIKTDVIRESENIDIVFN